MKKITWIVEGSFKKILHKNARLKPAKELAQKGWDVTMITSGIPENITDTPVNFIEVSWPKIYFLGAIIYYLKILRLFFCEKIDTNIIFFQIDSRSWLLLGIILWQKFIKQNKYKIVIDYRSLPMDTKTVRGKIRSLYFYLAVMISKKMNIPVTAITRKIAQELKISKNQLVGIWPSGAEIDDFKFCHKNRHWPLENEPIKFIYLGIMSAERNLISVIKGACIAKNRGINLTLDIIGNGEQKKQLEKLVRQKNINFINIDGPFPYHMVPQLLSKMDIGILPFPDVLKMNVSSAIKMFEYMAAGMPVMATKIEAHFRVFNDQDFVFWTDETPESMAETMTAISDSKKELPILGKRAMDYSRSWTWAESAKKLSTALEKVISR